MEQNGGTISAQHHIKFNPRSTLYVRTSKPYYGIFRRQASSTSVANDKWACIAKFFYASPKQQIFHENIWLEVAPERARDQLMLNPYRS
jgi:hypothetical protein